MVTFLYSHCREICPLEGELLGEVARSFIGAAVQPRLLVVSVDPRGDTAQASTSSRSVGAGPATGTGSSVASSSSRVWAAYGFDVKGPPPNIGHSTGLYIVDQSRLRAQWLCGAVPVPQRDRRPQDAPTGSGHRVRDLLLAGAAVLAALALSMVAAGRLAPRRHLRAAESTRRSTTHDRGSGSGVRIFASRARAPFASGCWRAPAAFL